MNSSPKPSFFPRLVDAPLALGLGALAWVVYLVTFTGRIYSIDEWALYAATAQLRASAATAPEVVRFAVFHNPVGALEPGYPWLAWAGYALAQAVPQVSNLHVLMMLNPLLTALTVSVVFLTGRAAGFGRAASLLSAAAFGLGSMAWPYTQSFLREPAVGLCWAGLAWGVVQFQQRPTWGWAGVVMAPAVLAVGFKVSAVVAWPVVLAELGWGLWRAKRLTGRAAVGLALAGAGLMLAAAGWLLPARGLVLTGLLGDWLAGLAQPEGWVHWYGLLFSPAKSVFLYSPVLLVAVLGWPGLARHNAGLFWLMLGLSVSVLASLQVTVWWGGLTWGPRFLLPLLPLLVLPVLALPVRQVGVLAAVGLSVAYQWRVVMVNWSALAEARLGYTANTTLPLDWARWAESPAWQIVWQFQPEWLHLVWWSARGVDVLTLAGGLAVLGLAAGAAWQVGRGSTRALGLSTLAGLAALVWMLGRALALLPDTPGLSAATARQLAQVGASSAHSTQASTLILVSPNFDRYVAAALVKAPTRLIWLSPAETPATLDVGWLTPGQTVWVALDRNQLAFYPDDWVLRWLARHAHRLGNQWVDGFEVFSFVVPATPLGAHPQATGWPTGVNLTQVDLPAQVRRGEPVAVALHWNRPGAWAGEQAALFTNLVNAEGVALAGPQGALGYGGLTAADWPPGTPWVERRAIAVPPDTPPGVYDLVVGFVEAGGFVPTHGPAPADYVVVGQVEIAP